MTATTNPITLSLSKCEATRTRSKSPPAGEGGKSLSPCTNPNEPPVTEHLPGVRHLPNFLTHGDAQLAALMRPYAPGTNRMRAMMGMPAIELTPAEGTAARDWLRHVEAGRIGG